MPHRYLSAKSCHLLFDITFNITALMPRTSLFRLTIDAAEWLCIKVYVGMLVKTLAPQSAHVTTSAVDVDAHIGKHSHQLLKLCLVQLRIAQRNDYEVAFAADGMCSVCHFLYPAQHIFDEHIKVFYMLIVLMVDVNAD